MTEHLPVLVVVVPFMAAPLCMLFGHGRVAWAIAMAATAFSLWAGIEILAHVMEFGTWSYAIGGWTPPLGIEYRLDVVNAFVVIIVAAIAFVVTPYALKSAEREVDPAKLHLFYTAWLLCFSGLLGISVTGDMFNVFVFLEISSLSAYALISLGSDRRALTAAFRYLIMGSVGATFIVIGIGMLYAMTGTLNMADMAARLHMADVTTGLLPVDTRTVKVGFAFLTVGVCLKLALFPLHLWLPNAYAYAPSSVTAFIAATATKVAVYMLLRFFFSVFGAVFSFDVMQLDFVLLPLALIAIFTMSLVAIYQENVKRMLAFSSVAQIGYMILGIAMVSVTGLTAGILHLFNHALIKAALFLAVGCVFYRIGSVRLEDMAGLGKRMPWTMGAFVGAGLSIIGVPLTVGFVSKWYLILGALEKGWWPVAVLVLITSLMALVYIWRVIEVAYFQEPAEDSKPLGEAPLSMLLPTWGLVLANFWFGIDAKTTVGVARAAAEALLGVGG